jgi:superfamily II DNA/RNA helicase
MADSPRSGEQTPDSETFGSGAPSAPDSPPTDSPDAAPDAAPEFAADAVPEPAAEAAPETPPEPDSPAPASFDDFELPQALREAVAAMGWAEPTPVQTMTFELVRSGRDVLVQSQTGSGKTGAFCLPWLAARFEPAAASQTGVQLLVLTPTRELAKQVCEQLGSLAQASDLVALPIYGGTAMDPQLQSLRRGVHAVVGTPGRILDHIRRRSLDLSRVRMVVLDEADEMLSMGFLEDIHAILETCATDRQTTLFSATVPPDIERIARRYMRNPEPVRLSGDQVAAAEIDHTYYGIAGGIRVRDLVDVINLEEPTTSIVFCNTREETYMVASVLQREGFAAEALSSDLTQTARERVMGWMRSGKLRFLVATDVASRGIDISHVSHVINYTFPENAESYIHRTGRTGRAGRPGVAISLIAPQELGSFYMLRKMYPSLRFEERKLPTAAELEAQRIETKLDMVSKLFPELVSPEWTLLARNLSKDPRGERVVAYLLSEAMSQRRRATVEHRGEDEAEPERLDRSRRGRERGQGREGDARGRDDRGRDDRGRDDRGRRTRGQRDDEAPRVRGQRDDEAPRVRGQRDDEAPRVRGQRHGSRQAEDEPILQDEVVEQRPVDTAHGESGDAANASMDPSLASTDDDAAPGEDADRGKRRRRRRRGKRTSDDASQTAELESEAKTPVALIEADVAPLAIGVATQALGAGVAVAEAAAEDTAEVLDDGALALDPAMPEGLATTDDGSRADDEPSRRRRRRRRRRRGGGAAEAESESGVEATANAAQTDTNTDTDADEASKGRRRRRRGGRRRGAQRSETAPAPAPHVSQDQIIIDIDESELEVVRDQFGEIDELDDLTLKGRRRGVIDDLQDEVELEELSEDTKADGATQPATADDDDTSDEDDDDTDDDAAAQAPEEGTQKKRRRRRRKKKKEEEAPAPELTAPPHKDFWEVWASKFNYREFEDEIWYQSHEAPPPEPSSPRRDEQQPARVVMAPVAEDDASFVSLRLNIGRKHGKKAAHIRELLDTQLGLSGRSVRNLTVGDASTRLRVSEQNFARVQETLGGYVLGEHEIVVSRIETVAEPSEGEHAEPAEPSVQAMAAPESSATADAAPADGAPADGGDARSNEGGEPSETVFG